jgi:hypothetical protein
VQPTDERQPTEDESLGMAWWNSLSEESRGQWATRTGTGVVADAWAAAKANVNANTEQP